MYLLKNKYFFLNYLKTEKIPDYLYVRLDLKITFAKKSSMHRWILKILTDTRV